MVLNATANDLATYQGLIAGNGDVINDAELGAGENLLTIRIIAVPEPSSLALLGLMGVCGLVRRRR